MTTQSPNDDELVRVATAYDALIEYLRSCVERDEVGDSISKLVHLMQPRENGVPLDQTQWFDFLEAIRKVQGYNH